MDAQSQAVLFDVVRHCGRSLLQYIAESDPWTTTESQADWERILLLVEEERELSDRALSKLRKQRITPPFLGAYPMHFTTINYMAIGHLLRLLVEAEKQWVAQLEPRIGEVKDEAVRDFVKEVLAKAQTHLQSMEEMQKQPQAT